MFESVLSQLYPCRCEHCSAGCQECIEADEGVKSVVNSGNRGILLSIELTGGRTLNVDGRIGLNLHIHRL